jgi:crotonobetainyl-CoA:carnitine CoA-transferase CaiB-like acyl-CoA transferase
VIYDGLRVLDTTTDLAGAYASKLLTDLGADVVALADLPAERTELFTYLRTSQRVGAGRDDALWPDCDVVLGGQAVLDDERAGPLVRVAISAFGAGGPDSALDLPEPVLQARSGCLATHGHMTAAPLTVAGELGEYVTGAFAALGAATAWYRASRTGGAETVDVSKLEAMSVTLSTVPTLMARFPGGRTANFRFVMIPGNEPCGDGNYCGITTVTIPQWLALLKAIGREDLCADDVLISVLGRFTRADEVHEVLHAFTMQHTAEEVVDVCAAARVPAAVVGNGRLLPEFEQPRARGTFVTQPGEAWIRPRAPFRFSAVADRELRAPTASSPTTDFGAVVGAGARTAAPKSGEGPVEGPGGTPGERPFEGIRVVDFTAFWSGPYSTAWLCSMGADVIKVESVQRPDGLRFNATIRPKDDPRFYEMSALWHATNLGKRGITLDLGHPDGLALATRLIETADVVAENFTPPVMEGFGLSYDEVRVINPGVVMLRLPAFGLDGPWRDRGGFAQTMEQITGMAWLTGYDDGPPIIPGGVVDPMVGTHAALALVAALEHRARTGEGQLVEMPMIEVAAAVTAEQVIEHSARGVVRGRRGDHGVHRCDGKDRWIAVDEASDPLDAAARAEWCATRTAEGAADELTRDGIPAAAVVPGYATLDDRHLAARGFFQTIDHPDVGTQDYPTWPMRMSAGPAVAWTDRCPTLGEHTDAVLRELGVDDGELARLRVEHVIGSEPLDRGR